MADEDKKVPEVDVDDIKLADELPVLPIRNAVLFPGAVAPFDVGREKSVALVEDIENLNQPIIVIFAQRDPATDDPRRRQEQRRPPGPGPDGRMDAGRLG